jgi:uncharacterized protein involved in cysteine biosynthesis
VRAFLEAAEGPPPARSGAALLAWGLAQPILGLRLIGRHPGLLRPLILPIAIVLLIAGLSATGQGADGSPARIALRFNLALAGLASVPSFLFANRYARLAARAHELLGHGPAEPRFLSLVRRVRQIIRFALVVALPIAPVLWIVGAVPLLGAAVGFAIGAPWTLHWVVVEALDNARIAGAPGATPPEWPWFLAWAGRPAFAPPRGLWRRPLAWAARRVRALTAPWHEEAALVAAHPLASIGFGLAVAGLLAVPIVNLLFRPAAIVGSVRFLAAVRARTAGAVGAPASGTAPSPGPPR